MNKKNLSLVMASIMAAVTLSGCAVPGMGGGAPGGNMPGMQQESTTVTVDMMTAEKGTLNISENYIGTAEAAQSVVVYPGTSGEITELDVKIGDTVSAGQILFKQDTDSAELNLKSAQAGYAQTAANVEQSLNGSQKLSEQKEQQEIDNLGRSVVNAQYNYSQSLEDVASAEDDYDDAADDEDDAHDDYKKAKKKLSKAKDYASDWSSLKSSEPAFSGMDLEEAANADSSISYNGVYPSDSSISMARSLLMDLNDDGLDSDDITSSGISALQSKKDSLENIYEAAQDTTDNYSDKVTSAERSASSAARSLDSANASRQQAIDNQGLNDGEVLSDKKKTLDAQLNSSAVNVESAQYQLDKCTTTAPIAGVIEALNVDAHDTVGASMAALTIANRDTITVTFGVTEETRGNLSMGEEVVVTKDETEYKGAITEISDVVNDSTGLFDVKCSLSGDTGILSGSSVSVSVVSYSDPSGIVIPYDAVYYSEGKPYIYVCENGTAKKRDIETGMFNTEEMVVTSGLEPGEIVITSWSSDLQDGAAVQDSASVSENASPAAMPAGDGAPAGEGAPAGKGGEEAE